MLSIGKLAAGQARYYLEQAEVRVDAVDSIEEYYPAVPRRAVSSDAPHVVDAENHALAGTSQSLRAESNR